MKQILFLLFALILLTVSCWDYSCFMGNAILCKLEQQGPFYNYNCLCFPKEFADSHPFVGYQVIKVCSGDFEEPKCYQNNIYSMELSCECNEG